MGSITSFGKKIFGHEWSLLLLLGVLVAMPYLKILGGYFQQDEWNGFAWFIVIQKENLLDTIKFFFTASPGHYNPLSLGLQYIFYYLWGIDYLKFAWVGLIMHVLTMLAVYYLAKVIFEGNKALAFLVALLFGSFASIYQGVSWSVVNISTLGAAFFGTVSATFFFVYQKKEKLTHLFLSIFFLYISLLFKETTIGLFILYFLLAKGKRSLIVFSGLAYIVLRMILLFGPSEAAKAEKILVSWPIVVQNFLTIPFASISQILIPGETLKQIAFYATGLLPEYTRGIAGSPEFELFAVRIVLVFLSLIIGFFVLAATAIKFRKFQPSLGLGWVIVNSLVFSYAPETKESVSLVDSRNLYFSSIGLAIFLVSCANLASKGNFKKIILFLLPVVFLNMYALHANLSRFVEVSRLRQEVLSIINKNYPDLPGKVVFFFESDTSYYGLPEETKILPFQSGLGQTLLVYYQESEKFPKEFLEKRFLWEIDSQGYKEIEGRGFGYFRDKDRLKDAIDSYKLDESTIISYAWEGKVQKLADTTIETRRELK